MGENLFYKVKRKIVIGMPLTQLKGKGERGRGRGKGKLERAFLDSDRSSSGGGYVLNGYRTSIGVIRGRGMGKKGRGEKKD